METPDNEQDFDNEYDDQPDAVEIYSKWAIRGFAIFFGTIFGGVLLFQNLRAAGYKKAALGLALFTIGYLIFSKIVIDFIPTGLGQGIASIVLNIIAAFIFSDYFYPKYFPGKNYYPKAIWHPLAISLLITFLYIEIIYYSGVFPAPAGTH